MILRILAPSMAIFLLMGCASTEESATDDPIPGSSVRERGPRLAPDDESIYTVQVHLSPDETSLPVYHLGSAQELRLAFDVLDKPGSALSIYFYHADLKWRRDLSASQFLESFNRDQITSYSNSFGTALPYVHYEYTFPNSTIDFTVSGNYILSVAERGQENDPLFERTFFVSEQAAAANMQLDQVMIGGRPYSSVQPYVRFTPVDPNTSSFDYTVCFVRNERYAAAECTDSPMLDVQPDLAFRLDPRTSFGRSVPDYVLDLSEIRQGAQITAYDQSTEPWEVILEPDYARFPGGSGFPRSLNGHSVIDGAVSGVGQPTVSAEYILTRFRFEPINQEPVDGSIQVVGSFSDWRTFSGSELTFNYESGRYEGDILIKQGLHEYRYVIDDPWLREQVESAPPRLDERFASFIYYQDISLQTDRLIAVVAMRAR